MDKAGIRVSSIGSPIGKIKITDDFDSHFEVFKKVVKIAKILETRYIRIFSFFGDGEWNDTLRKEVILKLRALIDYAQKEDIILLHENEKDIYGDTKERCLDLMKELSCDNFKAVFDPANFVQCGVDTKEAYEMLKPYVEYMHIKDALSSGIVVPAGEGIGNVEYILKDLFKNGYNGFLSLEPHLGEFEGLAFLEMGDLMKNLPKSSEGTFTLAYRALKNILERI